MGASPHIVRPYGAAAVMTALWASAAFTAIYWIVFFTGGELHSTEEPCYLVFESAFPLADAWLAALCVASAEGLRRGRAWAVFCAVAAGSAFVYLGCMDVLYNLEHGMYRNLGGPMVAELVINLWSFGFGTFLMRYAWRLRFALA
jgi:hypothetical protein